MSSNHKYVRALPAYMIISLALSASCLSQNAAPAQNNNVISKDGTEHFPAFDLPLSSYMSESAKRGFLLHSLVIPEFDQGDALKDARAQRTWVDENFHKPLLERAKATYRVKIESTTIAGVHADVVTPKDTERDRSQVLINLHGGGFVMGAGMGGLIESIPIADVGKIKVISVDYRQGPEYRFPAASEDVAAVYRELLKSYRPKNIGIYGCSAGGILTAMSMAWFQKEKLPNPGAIGIFCAADASMGGDSRFISADPSDIPPPKPNPPPMIGDPYLSNVDPNDPLVSPVRHPDILKRFPPTLFITGTRDPFMSSVLYMHTQLVKVGVTAELHVWDGMWHAFFMRVDMAESKETYATIVNFFDKYLGHPASSPSKRPAQRVSASSTVLSRK